MFATIPLPPVNIDFSNVLFEEALHAGRRRKFWTSITHRKTQLRDLVEYKAQMRNGSFQGQQEVAIDAICGSESRQKEFDDRFNPLSEQIRQRWQSIARAIDQGVNLPPVELLRVGKIYFVRDGHHRVSVARALGWKTINANVTVWNTV